MLKNLSLLLILSFTLLACSSTGPLGPDGKPLSESDLVSGQEARFGEGEIPFAEGEGAFRDIHFAYDSSSINDSGMQDVEYNLQLLQSYPDVKVQLEGHCDERGTAEYNMALGSQRAKSVSDLLTSYGIEASRIATVSYGEELPIDTSSSDQAWAKNRRVHFSAFK